MYSIQNIIWGVPFTSRAFSWMDENGYGEPEDLGFQTFYSGSSSTPPGYCGVCLGQIDEAADYVTIDLENNRLLYKGRRSQRARAVPLQPTDAQKQEAEEAIAKLPEKLRKLLPPIGLYVVFSTS